MVPAKLFPPPRRHARNALREEPWRLAAYICMLDGLEALSWGRGSVEILCLEIMHHVADRMTKMVMQILEFEELSNIYTIATDDCKTPEE